FRQLVRVPPARPQLAPAPLERQSVHLAPPASPFEGSAVQPFESYGLRPDLPAGAASVLATEVGRMLPGMEQLPPILSPDDLDQWAIGHRKRRKAQGRRRRYNYSSEPAAGNNWDDDDDCNTRKDREVQRCEKRYDRGSYNNEYAHLDYLAGC